MTFMTFVVKRLIDIVLSSFVLVVFLPVWIVIGMMIKRQDGGDVFYKQQRVGLHNGEFTIYKFRTMIMDAEKDTGVGLTAVGDSRITRLGDFLRKTRLDEIPNFINVFLGEMSVVGPRAERREIYEQLEDQFPMVWERTRHIKPGITGYAQLELNSDGSINPLSTVGQHIAVGDVGKPDNIVRYKMYYDFAYAIKLLNFWSFIKTDLMIMIKTPLVMFIKRNVV